MSSEPYDAVVIGGGHNGLTCAAYLARAGLRVIVLERRERFGGAADTAEIEPGVRAPVAAHTVGRLRRSVVRDLELERHGFEALTPDVRAFAPDPDGGAVTLWADPGRTAEELRGRSPADAGAYPRFDRMVRALASFMAYIHAETPPDLDSPSLTDAFGGLRLLRALKRLGGAHQAREVFRVLPMPVSDVVSDAFEDDHVRAVLATRGVRYTAMGPRSAGTTMALLTDSAGSDGGAAGEATVARGGPGSLSDALAAAARGFGAEIRTGVGVVQVLSTEDLHATGVALESGEEIGARVVVSAVDPKRTLLELVDPVLLGPRVVWRAGNLRLAGAVAKVNLSLSGLPSFVGTDGTDGRLAGRIVLVGGLDDLDRAADAAKYGQVSDAPYLEATIPTLLDPTLAPKGRHVMSVLVQWAPYRLRDGDWETEREGLGDFVLKTLETFAPGISNLVTARQVLTPVDLETEYGLTGGHPMHGELSLDQFFAWRPMLGMARYRLPVEGLYLAGSGAHPGGGITGAPGANAAREILADLRGTRTR